MEIGISSDSILPEMLGTFQLWRATGHFLRMSMYFHIAADILFLPYLPCDLLLILQYLVLGMFPLDPFSVFPGSLCSSWE